MAESELSNSHMFADVGEIGVASRRGTVTRTPRGELDHALGGRGQEFGTGTR